MVKAGHPERQVFVRNQCPPDAADDIYLRQRSDVARRALEHRHMSTSIGDRRNQGNRGGTGTDDNELLVLVVDVTRPVLRVHDVTGELFLSWKIRAEALRVGVVT